MNRAEQELFDTIMSRWVSYKSKTIAQEEIGRTGECLEGRIYDFKGDIPESSAYKFDTVGPRVDKMRKIYITQDEHEAVALVNSLPRIMWVYVTTEAWEKRREGITHESIAIKIGCTVDAFRKGRQRAKAELVRRAKEKYPAWEKIA